MKKLYAACCAVSLLIIVAAPIAHAATNVNVRIEGKEETLFEGVVPTTIHPVQALSDTEARECDALSETETEPAPTPTLASAEAMESIGETFDAQWYGYIGPYGDYFLTRWGPDEQDNALGAWWGILVNNVFTSVGGCQYRLKEDDEVLWIWNAFNSRPMLALFPEAAHYTEGPRPTRVIVAAGEPVPLEVVAYPAGGEGTSPEVPSRAGSTAFEGAEVAPVTVDAKGFQRVDTASPETVVTDAVGKTSVTYDTPGIYRIKATSGEAGNEPTVRSNGLEICVEGEPGECGEGLPGTGGSGAADDPDGGDSTPTGTTTPTDTSPPAAEPALGPAATKIANLRLDRSDLAHGRLKLGWQVLDFGAGVKSWRIGVRTVGGKGNFVTRARGTRTAAASIRLAPGHRYRLRLTLTDDAGHTSRYGLGTVAVPRAPRG
jgi:hypothetical protein